MRIRSGWTRLAAAGAAVAALLTTPSWAEPDEIDMLRLPHLTQFLDLGVIESVTLEGKTFTVTGRAGDAVTEPAALFVLEGTCAEVTSLGSLEDLAVILDNKKRTLQVDGKNCPVLYAAIRAYVQDDALIAFPADTRPRNLAREADKAGNLPEAMAGDAQVFNLELAYFPEAVRKSLADGKAFIVLLYGGEILACPVAVAEPPATAPLLVNHAQFG